MEAKKAAAEKAVALIQSGMIVGLGTGSTAYFAIQAIGSAVRKGLVVQAVATSAETEALAKKAGIPMADFSVITAIDIAIDGADEVDAKGNLIKGGGGALLREKMVAYHSKKFIVVVDDSKLVTTLGRFPLPVEITPFAAELTLKKLVALGCSATLRQKENKNFVTDNGNHIADCAFGKIETPEQLHQKIKEIPGVVETGLFINTMVSTIYAGYADGTVKEIQPLS